MNRGALKSEPELTGARLLAYERLAERKREREAREARERREARDREYARYDLKRNNKASHARIERPARSTAR